jgi:SPW repeat-containing protein
MQRTWKKEALTDVVNLVLGVWLFLSPWIFGFHPETAASWNAWLSGIVIAALAVSALAAFAEWEEWLNLIVGLWVAVSPWVVGFSANAGAARDHLVVGVIVAVVAAVRLWLVHQGPPRVTA